MNNYDLDKKIRVGAINWDASATKESYFGFNQIESLSSVKYRTWVPFYAELIDDEHIDYPLRSVEEYEREMSYAIKAGIDYWAFVWYPRESVILNSKHIKENELNYAFYLYEQSSLTDKIGMCAVIESHRSFTNNDLEELINLFSKPYYEKVDGRPLLYIFGGYKEELIESVHSFCKTRNLPVPFTVPLCQRSYIYPENMPLADALSAYSASNWEDVADYEEHCRIAMENDRIRMSKGKNIIPLFSVGWNPAPRIDRLTPWMTNKQGKSVYPNVHYANRPNEQELLSAAKELSRHIKNCVGEKFIGHILTYAWNEFEEGGYICPTYTQDGKIDDSQVKAFSKAVQVFHSELEE